ncbi:hypothetical protein L6452_07041 [Arctium lappa]|uniref:Uncharacterized protein n=1 Tax=Arctium lappa TaxID=4217 RepID=A0ACB9EKG5_ARCLA|nr:hypothetical protein L6452_07041 [Arctium lappa]
MVNTSPNAWDEYLHVSSCLIGLDFHNLFFLIPRGDRPSFGRCSVDGRSLKKKVDFSNGAAGKLFAQQWFGVDGGSRGDRPSFDRCSIDGKSLKKKVDFSTGAAGKLFAQQRFGVNGGVYSKELLNCVGSAGLLIVQQRFSRGSSLFRGYLR